MIINRIDFPVYGIIILISLVLGGIFNYIYLKKNKIELQYIILFLTMILLFAIVGGKFLSILFEKNRELIFSKIGLSSYEGAIGVIVAAIIFEKIYAKDKIFIKSAVLSLPLIYSISKLACFFAGCCYGLPCENRFFSVTYTDGLNIPLIPIQLIETIVFGIIFIVCLSLRNKKNIICITILISAFFKFILDFFRYNHLEETISKNQIISIFFILSSIFLILRREHYVVHHKQDIINKTS